MSEHPGCSTRHSSGAMIWFVAATVVGIVVARIVVPRAAAEQPALGPVAKDSSSAKQDGDRPGNDAAQTDAVRSPQLIAIGWQLVTGPVKEDEQPVQPIWRPDGTLVTKSELERLRKAAVGFQLIRWEPREQLRPLVLVFQQDSKTTTGIMPRIYLSDRDEFLSAGAAADRSGGLTVSSLQPQRTDLPAWPEKIDIEIKVPLENWTIIKTLNEIPDEAVDVGPGVRWYISPDKGMNFSNRNSPVGGLMAAVLETRGEQIKSLVNYDARVWLKDDKQPIRRCYSTGARNTQGVNIGVEVSMPIEDASLIQKVEFLRQRFRFERIDAVHTRPELLPEGDQ